MLPPIADQFVAGEDISTALDHTRSLNDDGVGAILNLLGEHYDDAENATADTETYIELVEAIAAAELNARISVKPSQIGLDIGDETFANNLARIVDRAADAGVFVWVDMEDHTTIDATLDAVIDCAESHSDMGLCVQANMKRTRDDLRRLVKTPVTARLVKGAYDPPKQLAYKDKADVNRAYRENLAYLFEHADHVAVGSHDPEMIERAKELHDEHGTTFEIQMLMGVRGDEQRALASEGYESYQYVPFGDKWLSYFYRRVRERKENALFAVRALLS
ncbi:MAG: proline dehydrogenase family protein [Halobacteriales archaeon]|nr:proline dehydrogenase family protein [Halobacteriales archaeon]